MSLLRTIAKPELIALWKRLFGRHAPPQLRRGLLIRILAYRIQEEQHGGLSPETRRRLREMARKFSANPDAKVSESRRIKPGTRLVRKWQGHSHVVTILDNGYEHAGRQYSSLSEITRAITGTRWSGPLFFGLKEKQTKKGPHGTRS